MLAVTETLVLLLIFIIPFVYISRMVMKKKTDPPEAGGSWPIIGHLHLLGGPEPPHMVLGKMADKYGPIFTIRMGMRRTLVVNNWEMAKECFTTNDLAFASRPNILAMNILAYDRSMFGFCPYGDFWRQMRKIATLELLSNNRLDTFRHVRESEVGIALKELYKLWKDDKSKCSDEVVVDMKRWFSDITLNVMVRIVLGKSVRYETRNGGPESDEGWKQALRDFFYLSGRFVPADAVPFLRWFDIGGYEKAMKKTASTLDAVVEEWLEEHKDRKASGNVNKEEEDFMHLMLDINDDEAAANLNRDSDTINKAICMTLILAGSDTTSITLMWALSLLVNNPEVLKKAQHELDTHVGRQRHVSESDINNLVYLKAVVKETLRLYPAGPLSVPHESMEDCDIGGYRIPSGTRLLTNLWKIHRDPRVWSDPSEFQPERFLTSRKDFDVRGQNFEFMPFGSGRRMCPGVSFAFQVVQLTLAALLHGFDFATPTGEPVDMTENLGLTNLRTNPLEVVISPRLEPSLYERITE